ncbi:AAA domain-containing protein [Candidatus Bathyarchaeota archaeon]|nr:AAA domain-containing protein [Candidatus Bathyarchaeota archaeon]
MNQVQDKLTAIKEEIARVVVGYEDVVDILLAAMLSGGHVLIEGPAGIGKTTLAKTFAQAIGGVFKRVQMTPDLLPADVIGVNVYNQKSNEWELKKGPIFCNVLLVDELNRASPKVQSAFLEVMQERQVTIEGESLSVPDPFMVLATQVPFSGTGTYVLTDVQLDRFGFKVDLNYPEDEVELKVLNDIDRIETVNVERIVEPDIIVNLGDTVQDVHVHERVRRYIVDLVLWLRGNPSVLMGPSTRASIWLMKGSRALSMIHGRDHVLPDDVKHLALSVLSHRLELTSTARAEDVKVEDLVVEALGKVPVPKGMDFLQE